MISSLFCSRVRLGVETLEDRLAPAIFTVTNEYNSGPGSLRAAINRANATSGADYIQFNIPGTSVHRIELLSALPAITDKLTINAASQPGYSGSPLVVLNGAGAGTDVSGLVVKAAGSVVRGLVINQFAADGIRVRADDFRIVGCFIGTGASSLADLGNGAAGVHVFAGVANTTIGGTGTSAGNVIVANGVAGILISGVDTTGSQVEGNLIGLRADGTAALPNAIGVWVADGSTGNAIGGSTGNTISGNTGAGISLTGTGTAGNTISGNRIGTNPDGTAAFANGGDGVSLGSGAGRQPWRTTSSPGMAATVWQSSERMRPSA